MTNSNTIKADKFNSLWLAFRYSMNRTVKPTMVFAGNDGRFWVVRMADAERLIRSGHKPLNFYELAR